MMMAGDVAVVPQPKIFGKPLTQLTDEELRRGLDFYLPKPAFELSETEYEFVIYASLNLKRPKGVL